MLFNIRQGLDQCKVFDGLNLFLRELMLATLEDRRVRPKLMPLGLYAAVIKNKPTERAAKKLRGALKTLSQLDKDTLKDALMHNSEPCDFLSDRSLQLPVVPDAIFRALKDLSIHLYNQTVKLTGVEVACHECVDEHYARFRAPEAPGNGNVCCVCGTESLAQIQAGVDDIEQWRGPYDHLLAKDRYPLYGVHPRNLVPICQTCNSKAKLSKDLLVKDNVRRLSFSPWTERAFAGEILVSIEATNKLFPRVVISLISSDADRQEKLDTWNDVYQIKARVEGEFLALHEKMSEDLPNLNEASFDSRLGEVAAAKASGCRCTPFNYWRARVYRAVRSMGKKNREALRVTIKNAALPDAEMNDLFFN